jgi:hypothetical protein
MLFEPEGNAREGRERRAMPFWLVVVICTIGVLVVWGLYLMARSWM